MGVKIDRRTIVAGGTAAAAALVLPQPARAANNAADLIRAFTGGAAPAQGKVTLDLPEIAENGSNVPMSVAVESPMTVQSHVEKILVVADGNPLGGVATFTFSPASGIAEAHARIRLSETQTVTAIARMNDGGLFMARRTVTVTVGGCGG